ncbi:hypothetical protein PV721_39940 [Streptomyces sp. MB09-01]|uniref:hypothetical protein n=1 Tax=Streptomyces sp. MB09-01 TaxID=3028666 RepID=UPI0029A95A1C|nr:hypothetical protein [Streptomyces sp. MB09-01]MDX3540373.1 hypothetical protein [Streptomyces sp. MB09-01]
MNHPVPATGTDSEALRTVIEAAIVDYLDGATEAEPDTADLAAHIAAAVERLLAARPLAEPAPEGDEV